MIFNTIKNNIISDVQNHLTSAVKDIAIANVRLSANYAQLAIELLESRGKAFTFKEEISDSKYPKVFTSWAWIGFPIVISIDERILTAGYNAVDVVANASMPRPFLPKFKRMLEEMKKPDTTIPVSLLQDWGLEKINELHVPDNLPEPLLDGRKYKDIEKAVKRSIELNERLGVILYGPPGNGKTTLAKWIALKFRIPMSVVSFNRDFDNHTIIRMFSSIKGPGVVLFEDFDSYFNQRQPQLSGQRFSFDVILNVIDGVFSPNGALIFIMTANDLNKIDDALKRRPSRFRFVKKIGPPSKKIRRRIFSGIKNCEKFVADTNGKSLDQVLDVFDRENFKSNCF